jgi:hypothetical protein
MKKLLFICAVLSVASCSYLKEIQSHCKLEIVSGSIEKDSYKLCGSCDSLAKITYKAIQKQVEKR